LGITSNRNAALCAANWLKVYFLHKLQVQTGNTSCELEIVQYKNTDTSIHVQIFKSFVSTNQKENYVNKQHVPIKRVLPLLFLQCCRKMTILASNWSKQCTTLINTVAIKFNFIISLMHSCRKYVKTRYLYMCTYRSECGNEPSGSIKCGEFLDWLKTG